MDIYNKNKDLIDRDSQLAIREWKEGVYFNTGMFFGAVEKVFLDNAPAEELTAPGRDPLAPAEFSAGWYYGLSGHDKRDKVLECYEKNPHLTNKLYDAMEAYIAGDTKKGDTKMDETRPLFKKALSECRRLDYHMFGKWAERVDDMVARSDWKEFALKVFKENKAVIIRDVDLEIREWKQGVHFNSGMFAGQIQKVFLDAQDNTPALEEGPKKDPMAPAEFAAGWYYGVTEEDKRTDILSCYAQNDDLTNALYDAMDAYIAGDSKTGDEKMKESKTLWDTAMAGCGKVAEKMGEIAKEFDDIQKRSDWDKVSKKIYEANKDVIDRDVSLELKQWEEGVFFNSGMFAGQIEKFFLDVKPERDASAPAQFVAGWYYGLTHEDDRDYILDCYAPSEDLTNALYDGMEAYMKGDTETGDKKMADTKPLFETALATCTKVSAAFEEWGKKFDDLKARSDWDQISKQIYEDNKALVDRNVGFEFEAWKEGVYFNSGMFAGSIEYLFLSKAPKEEDNFEQFMFMVPF